MSFIAAASIVVSGKMASDAAGDAADTAADAAVEAYGADPGFAAWKTIGYAYDYQAGTNGEHSVFNAVSWEEDADELNGLTTGAGITELIVGNAHINGQSGETIYISDFVILSTYEADCASLTGW